jgi:hypothetical protein
VLKNRFPFPFTVSKRNIKMKIQNVFGTAYLLVGLLMVCAGVLDADDKPCKVPSESQKKCFHPNNAVTDCTAWPQGDCVGHSIYVINDFPDGTTPASEGTTAEEMVDCYQETRCRQDPEDPTKCISATPFPYIQGAKVVSGLGTCPTE